MKHVIAMGLLLCNCTTFAALAEEPLIFRASAKVSISAAGEVTGVEPDPSLSPALQRSVRDEVLRYRFEPPTQAGQPVAGTTYVSLGGCAVPDGSGYKASLAYKGAGPQVEGGMLPPPRYPERAYMNGAETDAVVTYIVQPDGSATLERIDQKGRTRWKREFDKTLEQWVGTLRYQPETLAGTPVRTRLEVPVFFALHDVGQSNIEEVIKRQHLSTPECTAATSRGKMEPVALDSPFRRLPSG